MKDLQSATVARVLVVNPHPRAPSPDLFIGIIFHLIWKIVSTRHQVQNHTNSNNWIYNGKFSEQINQGLLRWTCCEGSRRGQRGGLMELHETSNIEYCGETSSTNELSCRFAAPVFAWWCSGHCSAAHNAAPAVQLCGWMLLLCRSKSFGIAGKGWALYMALFSFTQRVWYPSVASAFVKRASFSFSTNNSRARVPILQLASQPAGSMRLNIQWGWSSPRKFFQKR